MRLDKYISKATGLSRSQARRTIRRGRVTVAGVVRREPAWQVAGDEEVTCQDEILAPPRKRYFMLHKPAGVVCATLDRRHPTVIDLLELPNPAGLHIAGRLDIDATGLVLVTDDGAWSHRITSPGHHCRKTYHVCVAEPLDGGLKARFSRGLMLHNEKRRTRPAELEILGPREARVTVGEGRYHQVKRMFAACNNRVTALHREAIGPIELDEALEPGESRPLREDEIMAVLSGPVVS